MILEEFTESWPVEIIVRWEKSVFENSNIWKN